MRAQLALARRHGARIRVGERVLTLGPAASGIRLRTDRGSYEAQRVVLAAGPWLPGLVGRPLSRLSLHRQAMFWFEAERPAEYRPDRFPVFIWMHGEGPGDYFYGFPTPPGSVGVKVAREIFDASAPRPETIERTVTTEEPQALHAEHISGRLRRLGPRCLRSATCIYTVAPDSDFVIDRHPEDERIVLVSACSGHGFKHSPAIGEAVAELVLDRRSRTDLSAFRLARLAERTGIAG